MEELIAMLTISIICIIVLSCVIIYEFYHERREEEKYFKLIQELINKNKK